MIDLHRDGDLWTVTINRPQKAGALTRDMLVKLAEIVESAQEAKVFVLTGTGTVFSAGADLAAAKAGLAVDGVWGRLSNAIAALPGLTIAALNGTVAGGAFGMILACDLRVAVPHAQFFYPVMRLGFLPPPDDPPRLTALIGPARAKMILMAGQRITAEQAQAWGLIDQIAPADMLETMVGGLAADALAADHAHIAGIKQIVKGPQS